MTIKFTSHAPQWIESSTKSSGNIQSKRRALSLTLKVSLVTL